MSRVSLKHFVLSCFILLHLFAVSVVAFETPLSPLLEAYVSTFRLGWGWGMYDVFLPFDRHVQVRGVSQDGEPVGIPFPGQTRPERAAGFSIAGARARYFLKAMSLPGGEPFRAAFLRSLCRRFDDLSRASLVVAASPIPPLHEWTGRVESAEEEIASVPCSP